MTAQRPPPCRGPYCAKLILLRIQFVRENLVLPNQSFTDPVLYGRPRPCRTKSESQASTSQLRQADRCQGKRKTLARPSSAKANAGHPPDQAAPEQSQGAPKAARQGKLPPQLRQADRRQGKRRALPRQPTGANSRHNSAKQTDVKARTGHPPGQVVPGALTVPNQSSSESSLYEKTLSCRTNPSPIRFCTGDHGLAEPNRNHRLAPHNSARRTDAKARAGRSPDQAAPGIQTEIASPQGDRRFQLQRSGTISSGPLKKLRVSCVHERDGKQVPCVRSLCSYARESRAC